MFGFRVVFRAWGLGFKAALFSFCFEAFRVYGLVAGSFLCAGEGGWVLDSRFESGPRV